MSVRAGAAGEVSRRWLQHMGTSELMSEAVWDDVAARLDAMPSVLRAAFRVMDAAIMALPRGLRDRVGALPGGSEYVHVVQSLTAVSYFDAVTRGQLIPMQRTPSSDPAMAEPRA